MFVISWYINVVAFRYNDAIYFHYQVLPINIHTGSMNVRYAVHLITRFTRFMGPTRGPPGADRTQMGPNVGHVNLAIWDILYIQFLIHEWHSSPVWYAMPCCIRYCYNGTLTAKISYFTWIDSILLMLIKHSTPCRMLLCIYSIHEMVLACVTW